MIDAKNFLIAGQQFHGHACPAMPMGLRAGAAAMNTLGVGRDQDKELFAILELGDGQCAHCFADGVQMISGCTFGKGNIRKAGYGKFGLTLIDRKTGRSVRVVPRAEVQLASRQTPFFQNYRMKGVPSSQVPAEVVEPLIQNVMNAPEDKLLAIGEIRDVVIETTNESLAAFVCQRCGEMVSEPYGRIAGEQKVCIPCQEALLAK